MTSRATAEVRGAARFTLLALSAAAAMWLPAGARAGDDVPAATGWSFDAFGTFGLVHSSETQGDFTASIYKPDGAGHSHAWSSDVDSRVGGQVVAALTSRLSADLQVIAEQNYDDTWRPHVEWANLKFRVTPDVSVRAGRTVLSSLLFADSRRVGYAMPWVRPPTELYRLVPVTSSDGVDATYRSHFGDVVNTAVGAYGRTGSILPGGGRSSARRQWALTDTIEWGAATVYATYHETHLTVDPINAFFDAFRNFGPQGIALADQYDVNDKRVVFFGLGGTYDPGPWFVTGEWATTNLHSVLGASTAWYLSGGYRFGQFTPYLIDGAVRADVSTTVPGLNLAALPPALAGAAHGLNAGLNALLAGITDQRTIAAGARWDFARNVDLKLQYDHENLGAGSTGTLVNLQPGFRPGGSVDLVSIAVDFLW